MAARYKLRSVLNPLFEIIFEDADLLVVNKPAGLVCHPTKGDELSSLISRARLHLGSGASAHICSRLDRETSGVALIARNKQTASQLGRLLEKRSVEKEYLAIAHGTVMEAHGLIELPLGKDDLSRIAIKDKVRPDGAAAKTEYWVERHFSRDGKDFTLLRLLLHTGRKHQIRIHLSSIGHPIVGDKLYGGDEDLYMALVEDRLTPEQRQRLLLPNQALHSKSIRFSWRGLPVSFSAAPDKDFTDFLVPCLLDANQASTDCHE